MCVCVCVYVCVCVFGLLSFVNTYFIKQYRLCLHIFVYMLLSRRIDLMESGGNIHTSDDGSSLAESTWKPINYGCFIDQFALDTIKSMWRLERIYTKIWRQRISVLITNIYIYIYNSKLI